MTSYKQPHISPNSFLHTVSTGPPEPLESPLIIYFITGNPGLIGYYHTFLSLLAEKTKSLLIGQDLKRPFQIYGHSLAGFELPEPGQKKHDAESDSHYYDLEEQIRFIQSKINSFVTDRAGGTDQQSPKPDARPQVILIGHSVGAYIAMEVLRRHREGSRNDSPMDFDVIGGAMLFPTVVDIAKSPSGQKLTVCFSLRPCIRITRRTDEILCWANRGCSR